MRIIGQQSSQAPNDKEQLVPTPQGIPASLGQPAAVLVDSGFAASQRPRR